MALGDRVQRAQSKGGGAPEMQPDLSVLPPLVWGSLNLSHGSNLSFLLNSDGHLLTPCIGEEDVCLEGTDSVRHPDLPYPTESLSQPGHGLVSKPQHSCLPQPWPLAQELQAKRALPLVRPLGICPQVLKLHRTTHFKHGAFFPLPTPGDTWPCFQLLAQGSIFPRSPATEERALT